MKTFIALFILSFFSLTNNCGAGEERKTLIVPQEIAQGAIEALMPPEEDMTITQEDMEESTETASN